MKSYAKYTFLVLFQLFVSAVAAGTFSVDPVGGVDSGTAGPFRTLTYAISVGGGNSIYNLAAGTYSAASGETFPITISGLSGVGIVGIGGQAVIDADGANTRVFVVDTASDNIGFTNVTVTGAAVVYDANVTGQSTGAVTLKDSTSISLSNCTITGNKATKTAGSNTDIYGAGVAIFTCDGVSFDNCRITDNRMLNNNWGNMYGAGIALNYSKAVSFTDTELTGNGCDGIIGTANDKAVNFAGAAVYSFAGVFKVDYIVSFQNCLFRGNRSTTTGTGTQKGACIALQNKSGGGNPTASFLNCTFLENIGEPIVNVNSRATVTDSVFVDNSMDSVGTVTYSNCLWNEFSNALGYHPVSSPDPARTPVAEWFVSPEGVDTNSGDADHPFRTLTKALSVLENNSVLHVAEGVYNTVGGETFPLALSHLLNVSIVGNGSVVIDAGRSSRVFDIDGCHGFVLENLAVTGGYAPVALYEFGGGVRLRACRSVLKSCMITNNLAQTAWSNSDTYGGGVYACGASSDLVLNGCLFADNDIGSTGGRQGYGGGLAADTMSSLVISNTVFRDNGSNSTYMKNGGGLYANAVTRFRLFNSLLAANRSTADGSAIYTKSAVELSNCTVADNLVSIPFGGTGAVTLRNCICTGNTADPVATLDHTMTTAPGFVGDSYLVGADSAAIDAGSATAESLGLGEPYTVCADGTYDTGLVDLGYHQISTGPVVAVTDLYVSPSGIDANDGLDAAHPLRSVTKALTLVQNGTTVHLAVGTYDVAHGETFPLSLSKTDVTLVCEDGTAVIDAADGEDCVIDITAAQRFRFSHIVFANGCRAGQYGGGLDIRNSSGSLENCVITNCVVAMNDNTQTTSAGGGMYILGSSVSLTNCTLVRNGTDIIASNNPRSHGGALYVAEGSSVELMNCSLVSNYLANAAFGTWGAAVGLPMNNASASLTLRNCLVVGHHRKDGTAVKSTISAPYGTLAVENCTVADNKANVGAIGNFGEAVTGKATVSVDNSVICNNGAETNGNMSVSYSLISDCAGDVSNHVIFGNPLFRNAAAGDYTLRGNSPCRDAGVNAQWMKSSFDLLGFPRIRGGIVDMGCYELAGRGMTVIFK